MVRPQTPPRVSPRQPLLSSRVSDRTSLKRYSILGYELPTTDDVLGLLPTPQLVLRSAVLGALLLAAFFISLFAWIVFYKAVGVKPGVTEVVWFQYGYVGRVACM